MASQYDNAREDIQEVLANSLSKAGRIERVVPAEQVTDIFQASKEAFDALVFYFSRLEMTGQSDKEAAIMTRRIARALKVAFYSIELVGPYGKTLDVRIPPGTLVGYDPEQDRARGFTVSEGGITVIAKADGVEHFVENEFAER